MKKQNKSKKILMIGFIVKRIIAFPFFAALTFIGAMSIWLRWIWNFAKHGGEAIPYTKKMNTKTIGELFTELIKQKDQTK